MSNYHFFAMMARMKYISRWSLMRNSDSENISEHSLEVAMIAHALAVISNVRFGNDLNTERAALIGMYHDTTEIITGDMPTPVKYFNTDIKSAYKEVEDIAAGKLIRMLPPDMQEYYNDLFYKNEKDEYIWKLVKAADKLSALLKCIKEEKMGNLEFTSAHESTQKALDEMQLSEIAVFEEEFLESFSLTLDELQR
jgi:metal dependent phosphohydrolase